MRHERASFTIVVALAAFLSGCQGTERPLAPSLDGTQLSSSASDGLNGKIVFHSGRAGNVHIFAMNADGTEQTQLTRTPTYDFEPVWSPNGRKIAYMRFPETCCGNSVIVVMKADGTGITQLTDGSTPDWFPIWSPNGKQIAFRSDRDGTVDDLFVMNADGSNVRRLTTNAYVQNVAAWSPNGKQIAFVSYRDYVANPDAGDTDLFVMNADGTGITPLTDNNVDDFGDHAGWSPDGKLFVFSRSAPGTNSQTTSEIFVMNANGTNARQLTGLAGNVGYNNNPTWSPNGKRIAFNSTRDGMTNEEVYTMNLDGSDLKRLTNSPSNDAVPSWTNGRVRPGEDEKDNDDRDGRH